MLQVLIQTPNIFSVIRLCFTPSQHSIFLPVRVGEGKGGRGTPVRLFSLEREVMYFLNLFTAKSYQRRLSQMFSLLIIQTNGKL